MTPPFSAPKAGIGEPELDGRFINRLGVNWYYNWRPFPSAGIISAEFVPMIWGRDDASPESLASLADTNRSGHLLSFNEPERRNQADLNVSEALEAWPRFMQTGFRLGSPAISLDRQGKNWLQNFMSQVQVRSLRVDFVCVHWYGDPTRPDASETLRAELGAIHHAYGLPVWLTEFGAMDDYFSTGQNRELLTAGFIQRTRPMLDALPFLERYAWFSTQPIAGYHASALFDPQEEWTAVGKAWRILNESGGLPQPITRKRAIYTREKSEYPRRE